MTAPWQLHSAIASYRPGEWIRDALCAQVTMAEFFPKKCDSAEPAKRICRLCPVRVECAEYAINSPQPLHGVWGGLSATERRDIRRTNGIKDEDLFEDWHGTEAGLKRHTRAGEKPCAACRKAASEAWTARQRAKEGRNAV